MGAVKGAAARIVSVIPFAIKVRVAFRSISGLRCLQVPHRRFGARKRIPQSRGLSLESEAAARRLAGWMRASAEPGPVRDDGRQLSPALIRALRAALEAPFA
jgi:hypothetical protein